ncbi:hypothetical protein I7I51_06349 [Histoplasma capsulatum]|uniref:Uncharacterized protein n=1 Tax=Ajellomyces capsulatus TaxID=5037 RepID=A0A8A1MI07_AJECA|nr:hypothetical protein I7I51_06349 [Histoplasma capsulatum]
MARSGPEVFIYGKKDIQDRKIIVTKQVEGRWNHDHTTWTRPPDVHADDADDGEDDREEDARCLARGMPEECSIAGGNNERYNGLAETERVCGLGGAGYELAMSRL